MLLRSCAPLLSIALLCAIPNVSRADTVYDVAGTFNSGYATLSGTYAISSAGLITAADLTIAGINFTNIGYSAAPSTNPFDLTNYTETIVRDATLDNYIDLAIYNFGTICSTTDKSCIETLPAKSVGQFSTAWVSSNVLLLTSGSASPSVSAAPEPSSLVLLGTGFIGLVGVARRKYAKV